MVLLRFNNGKIVKFQGMIGGMGLPLLITFVACILICVMKRRSERNVQRRPNVQQNRLKARTDSANGNCCVLVDVVAIYNLFNSMDLSL